MSGFIRLGQLIHIRSGYIRLGQVSIGFVSLSQVLSCYFRYGQDKSG